MNAKVTIETITPQAAAEMIKNLLPGQRKQRRSHVDRIKKEIAGDSFRLSCDAIVLIGDYVANGQHRLKAVSEMDKPCDFLVMRTDDRDIYKIIDSGIKRTVGDVLGVPHAAKLSAVSKWTVDYDLGNLSVKARHSATLVNRSMVVDFASEHTDALTSAIEFIIPLRRIQPILSLTQAASFLFIASRAGLETQAKEFLMLLFKGSKEDAAFDLRERIIKNQTSKAKLPASYIFGLLLKSFKSFTNGTRLGVLKISEDEEYPKI